MNYLFILISFYILSTEAFSSDSTHADATIFHLSDRELINAYTVTIHGGPGLGVDSVKSNFNTRRLPDPYWYQITPDFNTNEAEKDSDNTRYADSLRRCSRRPYSRLIRPRYPIREIENFFSTRSELKRNPLPVHIRFAPTLPNAEEKVSSEYSEESSLRIIEEGSLNIIECPGLPNDEFFIQISDAATSELSLTEELLAEHFIHYFFKARLVRTKYPWHLSASPLEIACDVLYPAAFPHIRMEIDSTLLRQVMLQWPNINPLMDQSINFKLILQLKNELSAKLDLLMISDTNRIMLSINLWMKSGALLSSGELKEKILEINVEQFANKMKTIVDKRMIDRFWFTARIPGTAYLEKMDKRIKFRLVR